MPRRSPVLIGASGAVLFVTGAAGGDFAVEIVEHRPAPGQNVNEPAFTDPANALGPPVGGGTVSPDNSKAVTLGGFGGSITLGFARTVTDDPRNPLGMDFIVFGNSFWPSNDPTRRWAEAGIIEISLDVNQNGLADDPWYVVPGSSIDGSPADSLSSTEWDNDTQTATPPADPTWYPEDNPDSFETSTFLLPDDLEAITLVNPNGPDAVDEGHWGYADLSPTMLLGDRSGATGTGFDNTLSDPEDLPGIDPGLFYTRPDDPASVGIDFGSGGGDAFDIAWAVDPLTGAPAGLPGFDFIRISTGVDVIFGPLGEASTEISGVADVRLEGDFTGDEHVSGADLAVLLAGWGASWTVTDLTQDGTTDGADLAVLLSNWDAQ